MAKTVAQSKIELTLRVELSEAEVRAFDALMGYGFKPFLDTFYKHMGPRYMKPHEAGLKSLFDTLGPQCSAAINRANAARKAFHVERYVVTERKREPSNG